VVGAFYLLIPYEAAYLIPMLPFALLLSGRLLTRPLLAVAALLIVSEVLVTPLFDQRRLVPGRLFHERVVRRQDLARTEALEARRPPRRTVFVVGRYEVHRLLVMAPSLERTDAAWAPFGAAGVALWSPDRRVGYASFLDRTSREALEREGYEVAELGATVPDARAVE
jgi:hypothetical protein